MQEAIESEQVEVTKLLVKAISEANKKVNLLEQREFLTNDITFHMIITSTYHT